MAARTTEETERVERKLDLIFKALETRMNLSASAFVSGGAVHVSTDPGTHAIKTGFRK